MVWDIDFIGRDEFKNYVKTVILQICKKINSEDVESFNKNIIDPIKFIFEKYVYDEDWETIITSEIARQRDKSADNDIGYFHQNIFSHFKHCVVPSEGWDVIFTPPGGVAIPGQGKVSTIYVELKNKHNTMNSSSAQKTYINMQHQLLEDDDCACFLVEAISKCSQNDPWIITIDKKRQQHKLIRRVSIDQFYTIVTGDKRGFFKICKVLPEIISEVIKDKGSLPLPNDKVYEQLCEISRNTNNSFEMALYMLAFSGYSGFEPVQTKGQTVIIS